jgi:hypothetical protein
MERELRIAFRATDEQKKILVDFCNLIKNYDQTIAVRVSLGKETDLALSMLQWSPYIYIGLVSKETNTIDTGATISMEDLKYAMPVLDLKHGHAATRKNPIGSEAVGKIWLQYISLVKSIEQQGQIPIYETRIKL